MKVLAPAFAVGKERFGLRLNHYSIQSDHLHLIVEAEDRTALTRGMKGLTGRIAKALNKLWSRKGSVFDDRYHDHILRTPKQVRNVLAYLFHNARKYGRNARQSLDHYCSGWWFDGFREKLEIQGLEGVPRPTAAPRTWLANKGWRRHGLIPLARPAPS